MPSYYLLLVHPGRQRVILRCWQLAWTHYQEIPLKPNQLVVNQPNRVRLEAAGHEFRVFINGDFVGQFRDQRIDTPGILALTVSAEKAEPNVVAFTDFRLSELGP